jgi:hypothetical protein
MPSTFTPSLRLEKQGVGENLNVWGVKLNGVEDRLDKAIAGAIVVVTSGGTVTLSTALGSDDEARAAILLLTGAGGTVVIPSVSKLYAVSNGASGPVTITTGAGDVAVIAPDDVAQVMCDGVGVHVPQIAGLSIKAYVDAQAFAALNGDLPGQLGNAGFFLTTNGAVVAWQQLTTADLGDGEAITAQAIAFAVAL